MKTILIGDGAYNIYKILIRKRAEKANDYLHIKDFYSQSDSSEDYKICSPEYYNLTEYINISQELIPEFVDALLRRTDQPKTLNVLSCLGGKFASIICPIYLDELNKRKLLNKVCVTMPLKSEGIAVEKLAITALNEIEGYGIADLIIVNQQKILQENIGLSKKEFWSNIDNHIASLLIN